jgi:general secretion pathway protein B
VSFILDALRKSEHERQRSAVPGLSQVPVATPQPQLPRWAVVVMGALAGVVLVLGVAWWQTVRAPEPAGAAARTVERGLELPPPATAVPPQATISSRPSGPFAPAAAPSLAAAAGATPTPANATPAAVDPSAPAAASSVSLSAPARFDVPTDGVTLPSAAALAAEGIAVPPLRLELHAFSSRPHERFVFINGRKYVEGERLVEGPQVVSIAPTGAVLAHAGRQFLLVQD